MRKFDVGSGISIIFVAVLAAVAYFYQDTAMGTMRLVLENGYLKIFLNMAIGIIIITHSIKVQAQSSSRSLLVKSGFFAHRYIFNYRHIYGGIYDCLFVA